MIQRNSRVIGGIYQTGQVITSGPMLTAYSAYNRNTGDVVGLHVIEPPAVMDEAVALRLLQPLEPRKLVQSPHVMHVYDWGMDGARLYIATDPPRGITLRQVLDTENVDLRRALELAQQMARGLAAMHSQGIVDIDMRPQLITVDILTESDRAQLDDIGLRLLLRRLGYPQGQQPDDIGSLDPRYASPEHIQQAQVGPWSDVYQLGLLIFEVVAGRLPFVGHTPAETGMMQVSAPAPRLAQYAYNAPPAWQDLLDRALAKDPSHRFQSAAALLSALQSLAPPPASAIRLPASSAPLSSGTLPATQGKGQTTEMAAAPAKKDISLQGTVIDGEDSTIFQTAGNGVEAEEGALAYLVYEPEGSDAQRFPIASSYVVVGRHDPKRDIRPEIDLSGLDQRMTVSRQHARIRFEETFFYIEDLKSRNRTRLGELTLTPLKAELLQHGDVLHFGSVRMVFRVPGMKEKPGLKDH
jgi:serine/threonine protein kinase